MHNFAMKNPRVAWQQQSIVEVAQNKEVLDRASVSNDEDEGQSSIAAGGYAKSKSNSKRHIISCSPYFRIKTPHSASKKASNSSMIFAEICRTYMQLPPHSG